MLDVEVDESGGWRKGRVPLLGIGEYKNPEYTEFGKVKQIKLWDDMRIESCLEAEEAQGVKLIG